MRRRDQKVIAAVLLVLLAGIESIGGGHMVCRLMQRSRKQMYL